jgi:hypothetical protein
VGLLLYGSELSTDREKSVECEPRPLPGGSFPLPLLGPPSLFGFNLQVAGARPLALWPRGGEREAPVQVPGAWWGGGFPTPARPRRLPAAARSLNRGVVFVFDPRALAAWHASEAGAVGAGAAEAEEDGAGALES